MLCNCSANALFMFNDCVPLILKVIECLMNQVTLLFPLSSPFITPRNIFPKRLIRY
ncbi:hypothetical protein KOSB73_280064 [Klebsiella grimontii]|uniref:Uncharacterized protein n=1 Tax=Klebsiella grimontii TaxID=2058152 RepID=A0A285B6G0_9ENTR|nr:hypothetical protein KOSB73_280064 [Klebsiella grimontii]